MSAMRALKSLMFFCAVLLSASCATQSEAPQATASTPAMPAGNPITGEGLPEPGPERHRELGRTCRKAGSGARPPVSTSIPIDGQHLGLRALRRSATSAAASRSTATTTRWTRSSSSTATPARCWQTSAAASWSRRTASTSTPSGNVWVTDFAGNAEGTKGHQVHKFSPDGELLMSLGTAGQPGNGPEPVQPAQRRDHRRRTAASSSPTATKARA